VLGAYEVRRITFLTRLERLTLVCLARRPTVQDALPLLLA
jgi:hypothetical protein